jgi:2-polyprenyl-3-methyl-5-hydroxy-6-metoxy-1,4-benzoquinol methylase
MHGPSTLTNVSLPVYARRTTCPCCQAPISKARGAVCSTPRAEEIPFEQHTGFLSGYGPRRVFFTYVRCGECDAYYCPHYYNDEQLRLLYEQQPENMADLPFGSRERTQMGYLDILRRHSRMAGGFLEIGADIGLFAEACARAGTFDHLWLSEPNRNVHPQIEDRFPRSKATVLDTMSPARQVPPGSISTVAMIHVLDHLWEPRTSLRDVCNTLEPGGVVLIVTHNARSWLARMLGRRWPPFTLQHPHLFSPRAMQRLMTASGFEVLEIVRTKNVFPASFLLRAALTVAGIPAKWVPEHRGFDIGIRLGNICTMARRAGS